MAISNKKVLEAVNVINDYCKEQKACQNCIFRKFGAEHWKCHMQAFDMQDVINNINAKKEKSRIYLKQKRTIKIRTDLDFI